MLNELLSIFGLLDDDVVIFHGSLSEGILELDFVLAILQESYLEEPILSFNHIEAIELGLGKFHPRLQKEVSGGAIHDALQDLKGVVLNFVLEELLFEQVLSEFIQHQVLLGLGIVVEENALVFLLFESLEELFLVALAFEHELEGARIESVDQGVLPQELYHVIRLHLLQGLVLFDDVLLLQQDFLLHFIELIVHPLLHHLFVHIQSLLLLPIEDFLHLALH